jgi:4-hydroxy-3-polyprenylbenzoate decarboxylase
VHSHLSDDYRRQTAMEDCFLGKATERLFLPLVKLFIPRWWTTTYPWFGVFHNFCLRFHSQALAATSTQSDECHLEPGQLMFSKIIVVVDEDVDVHNYEEVWFHVGANVHPGRDVVFCEGPTDILDHAARCVGSDTKWALTPPASFPKKAIPDPGQKKYSWMTPRLLR